MSGPAGLGEVSRAVLAAFADRRTIAKKERDACVRRVSRKSQTSCSATLPRSWLRG